jgi:phasin family protein
MLNTTEFTATNQANLDIVLSLAAKTFEGVEQLTALNLQVIKANLAEAAEFSLAALSAKDPQSLLALQSGALQPAAEKAAAYGRHVYDIFASTKAEIENVVAEQIAGRQKSFVAAIDEATKTAPEASRGGIAIIKSAMTSANEAFEGLQKATRQASDAAEANYTNVTDSVVKAAGKAKRA